LNDRVKIILLMVFTLPLIAIIFGVMLFIPANDYSWLEGWIFIIVFLGYIILYYLYFLVKDPEIIIKRSKFATDDPNSSTLPDKTFLILVLLSAGFVFIFPAIDHNLKISPMLIHPFIEAIGFIGLIISLLFILYINQVNRYASKGLVIHKDHELITSGPYRFIRHPMYLGFLLMMFSIPLSLGSFIAFVVSLFLPIVYIYRIGIEEKMLMSHLVGYKEYMDQVKYRLIPKIY